MESILSSETLALTSQIIGIISFLLWIAIIMIQFKRMKYSFWYIFVRKIFYNDKKPINWLSNNLEHFWGLCLIVPLLLYALGLVQQIQDSSVYDKPVILFIANPALVLFAALWGKSKNIKNQKL